MRIDQWLSRLIRWISNKFTKKRQRKSPKILKRWYSEHCAMLRLERFNRGAVDTYRIIPRDSDWDLLLTLDSKREIEAEMAGEFDGVPFLLRSHSDIYQPLLSHRVAIFRVYRTGNCVCVGCWDLDLERSTGSSAGAVLVPKRIFFHAALTILKIEPTKALTVAEQLEMIDWLGLIESSAREYLGKNFNLVSTRKI